MLTHAPGQPCSGSGSAWMCAQTIASTFCMISASRNAGTPHDAYDSARSDTSTIDPSRTAQSVPTSSANTSTSTKANASRSIVCAERRQHARPEILAEDALADRAVRDALEPGPPRLLRGHGQQRPGRDVEVAREEPEGAERHGDEHDESKRDAPDEKGEHALEVGVPAARRAVEAGALRRPVGVQDRRVRLRHLDGDTRLHGRALRVEGHARPERDPPRPKALQLTAAVRASCVVSAQRQPVRARAQACCRRRRKGSCSRASPSASRRAGAASSRRTSRRRS